MNTAPATNSRRDEIVTAIGVLILLIGGASGNAIVMLILSVVALAIVAVIYRQMLSRPRLLLTLIGACAAAAFIAFMMGRY